MRRRSTGKRSQRWKTSGEKKNWRKKREEDLQSSAKGLYTHTYIKYTHIQNEWDDDKSYRKWWKSEAAERDRRKAEGEKHTGFDKVRNRGERKGKQSERLCEKERGGWEGGQGGGEHGET